MTPSPPDALEVQLLRESPSSTLEEQLQSLADLGPSWGEDGEPPMRAETLEQARAVLTLLRTEFQVPIPYLYPTMIHDLDDVPSTIVHAEWPGVNWNLSLDVGTPEGLKFCQIPTGDGQILRGSIQALTDVREVGQIVKDRLSVLVVASVSGGKDSAALSLWLTSKGIPHRRVFADTGWEHDLTYEYLRGPLKDRLGHIDEVGFPGGMRDLVLKKKMFPSRLRRFCTEHLKVKPILAYIRELQDRGHEVVNVVGIRAAESEARSKMTEWEWNRDFDCWVWRPLIAWTEQQVIDMHKDSGLAPNPLYLKGATRVGCWPCIFARKSEIKMVARMSPERIDAIRVLENTLPPSSAKPAVPETVVNNDDGTTSVIPAREAQEPMLRTFFHGKLSRRGLPFPIDTIVTWSQTKYGGKEVDPVVQEDDQPDGCVRWGLCEKGSEVPEGGDDEKK